MEAITRDGLCLKRADRNDAAKLAQLAFEYRLALAQWLEWVKKDSTVEELVSRLEKHPLRIESGEKIVSILFTLHNSEDKLVGMLNLRPSDKPMTFYIGYWIAPVFTHRGYASRGIRLLAGWCREAFSDCTLLIETTTANKASQNTAMRAGFQHVESRFDHQYNLDLELYSFPHQAALKR